jgi:hypothetical protein
VERQPSIDIAGQNIVGTLAEYPLGKTSTLSSLKAWRAWHGLSSINASAIC